MSIKLMTAAWETELAGNDLLLLLALADWANDDGHCWPSIPKLCAKTRASERTVQGIIKQLVAAGHLTRQEKPGCGCKYIVHPRRSCAHAETAPPQLLPDTPADSAGNTPRNTNRGSGEPLPPNPPKPRQAESDASPAKAMPAVPDWLPVEAWDGFREMRRRSGKPLTARAAELLFAKLKALADDGHPPGAVLDQSTLNGWQGVFGLKGTDDGRQRRDGGNGQGGHGRAGRADSERWPGGLRDPVLRDLAGRGSGILGDDPAG